MKATQIAYIRNNIASDQPSIRWHLDLYSTADFGQLDFLLDMLLLNSVLVWFSDWVVTTLYTHVAGYSRPNVWFHRQTSTFITALAGDSRPYVWFHRQTMTFITAGVCRRMENLHDVPHNQLDQFAPTKPTPCLLLAGEALMMFWSHSAGVLDRQG